MDVVLSTRNLTKGAQVKQVFFGSPVNVMTLDDALIMGEAVEDGAALQENALKKALYAHARVPPFTWTMGVAEDRGTGETVVLVIDPDGKEHVFRGTFQGAMLDVLQYLARAGATPVSY